MKRRLSTLALCIAAFLTVSVPPSARALDEAERLWLVGERASADGLYVLAGRTLERFVAEYPKDPRQPQAVLLLGRARLAQGDAQAALEAFRRVQTFQPPPGRPQEGRFWEGEALFRLKRFAEARTAYDEVLRADSTSPLAPDALYGLGWSDLELKKPESAVKTWQDFVTNYPDHPLAGSATYYLARTLVDLKRKDEALPLLVSYPSKFPSAKQLPDARYLLGWVRVNSGDARTGIADLRAFVAAYPNHPEAAAARRLISQGAARSGSREEQLEAYRALMAQEPATPQALAEAASVAGRLGRTADQEAALRKLRTQFPDDPLARRSSLEQATAAFKRKEWKEAVAFAQPATQSGEEAVRGEAWLLTGESELKLKRYTNAVKAFEAVGALKTVEPTVRYRALAGLGLAREEQQDWKSALTAYETVAARSPDDTLKQWARERATEVKTRMATTPSKSAPADKKSAPADSKAKERS